MEMNIIFNQRKEKKMRKKLIYLFIPLLVFSFGFLIGNRDMAGPYLSGELSVTPAHAAYEKCDWHSLPYQVSINEVNPSLVVLTWRTNSPWYIHGMVQKNRRTVQVTYWHEIYSPPSGE